MRSLFFLATLLVALSAQAAQLVVIQGDRSEFSRRYFSGFSSFATEPVKAFYYEEKNEDALLARVKKLAPDLIFTIGKSPLKRLVGMLPSTPILAGDPYVSEVAKKANVVVLESEDTLRRALEISQQLFPARKSLGTVYNPKLSQEHFDRLTAEGGKLGLRVASLKVDAPADVQAFMTQFVGKTDLLYWIQDATTSADAALTEFFSFAEQNGLPVLSPDPDQLQRGAFLCVSADPFRLGEQAWKTAELILKEGKIPQMPVGTKSDQYTILLSMKSVGKFGIGADKLFAFLQTATKEGYRVQIRE